MLKTILVLFSLAVRGVISALLPPPERDRVIGGYPISAARWSLYIGLIGGGGGLYFYMSGALAFIVPLGGDQGVALLDTAAPGYVSLGGLLAWLAWQLQPEAWLFSYLALVGFARVLAFLITGEAIAEPSVLLPLRAVQWLTGGYRKKRRLAELGPERPDRALVEKGCDLVILSCREKPELDELATIKVGGRFYRLLDVEDIADGRWRSLTYRL